MGSKHLVIYSELWLDPDIAVGVLLVLDYPGPLGVPLHHLPHGLVVIVVHVHPGLCAQAGVSHPVESKIL